MHILSPETDNCPSWISGRERMTVENISWSISTKECCRPRRGLNPRPPNLQSDALKVSWLRRKLQQSDTGGWKELAFINFSKIFLFGAVYAVKLSSNLQNPFWKELIQVWSDFCKAVSVENIKYFYMPFMAYWSHWKRATVFKKLVRYGHKSNSWPY